MISALCWILNIELMPETLTVMGVDSADSREQSPREGVMKFLKTGEKKRLKAVSFELD